MIWGNLADCYSALANFGSGAEREAAINQAAQAFTKAIELKPDEAGYHYSYSLTLVKLLRFNESLAEMTRAAQSDPFNAGSYFYSIGTTLSKVGQIDLSGQAFMRAIEAQPNYANAHFQYALYLISKATRTADGKIVWQPGTVEALQRYLTLEPHGEFSDQARRLLDTNSSLLRDIPSWKVDPAPVDVQTRKLDLAPSGVVPEPAVYQVGGDVTTPSVTYRVDSSVLHTAGYAGLLTVYAAVGPDGLVRSIRMTSVADDIQNERGLASNLDEKAIGDVIRQWRFTPGLKNGQPATVEAELLFKLEEANRGIPVPTTNLLNDIQSWKVDPAPVDVQSGKLDLAPVGATPTLTPGLVRVGQTEAQVAELAGPPEQSAVKGRREICVYHQYAFDMVTVTFENGRAVKVSRPAPRPSEHNGYPNEQDGHPKLERALGIAAGIAAQLYLTNACPPLRRKPLLWWTAGDQQTWQACIGNGFFIGPLYIYTGLQQ